MTGKRRSMNPGRASATTTAADPDDEPIPQRPGAELGKIGHKGSEAGGPLEAVKRSAGEVDRDLSGSYELRQEENAARVLGEKKERAGSPRRSPRASR